MKAYKITWYNMNSIVLEEADLIHANNEEDARNKAYTKYNGNPPAPCILIEEAK